MKQVEIELEVAYQDIQAALIQVRQAAASMLSTNRSLEESIDKNELQMKAWEEREEAAIHQNDQILADEAREKAKNYQDANSDLRQQLDESRKFTEDVKKQLNETERFVTRFHTHKMIYTARSRALRTARTLKAFSEKADLCDGVAEITEAKRILAEEGTLGINADGITAMSSEALLDKAVAALQQSTAVIERLENVLMDMQKGKK